MQKPSAVSDKHRPELEKILLSIAHDMAKSLLRVEDSLKRLRRQISDVAMGTDSLAHLDGCVRQLGRRVQDLGRLARKGTLRHDPCRFDLGPIVAEAMIEQRPLLERRGISVQVVGTLTDCWGDPQRIKQAVTHLVRNAALYGCDGNHPQITISSPRAATASDEPIAVLRIHGNGPKDRASARAFAEDDLGMAMVREICQAHGGTVQIDPESRHGVAAVLSLPVDDAARLKDDSLPHFEVQVLRRWKLDADGHRHLAAASGRAMLPQRPHYRVATSDPKA